MLDYCVNDVIVNAKVYEHLKQEGKGFSSKSVEIEQKVYRLVDEQRKDICSVSPPTLENPGKGIVTLN